MKKSFTLLEMLVVIGIIATLVGFGALSYSTAQKKARDAKRQGDLKAVQQILEQCYTVNTASYQYPDITDTGSNTLTSTCPGTPALTFTIKDPLNSGSYVYTVVESSPVGTSYTIISSLESGATFSVTNQQ